MSHTPTPTTDEPRIPGQVEGAAQALLTSLTAAAEQSSFEPLLLAIVGVLEHAALPVDRIQVPMTKATGFRHPTWWGIILTWSRDDGLAGTDLVPHVSELSGNTQVVSVEEVLKDPARSAKIGPFVELLREPGSNYRVRLQEDALQYDILATLRDRGYIDYISFAVDLPGSTFPQFFSLASKSTFPDEAHEVLAQLKPLFAMSMYAALRTSQAMEVARTYLGHTTGLRVLEGEITRGTTQAIDAGIMFCDVRGFTALSQRLGASSVVDVMNRLFEAIGVVAQESGGEILKFIGDAMLVVFRIQDDGPPAAAQRMVATVERACEAVEAVANDLSLDVRAGFGCHIGGVAYGNIGTPQRLDFTIMGPAVNLASRLESLTKQLGVSAVFSAAVAQHVPQLQQCGSHNLKGVAKPVVAYTLPPQGT